MNIPENPVRKAVKNPGDAIDWIHNRIIEKRIHTPIRGRYLFDSDWDIAIILDACRYDFAKKHAEDYDSTLGNPERVYSVASNSAEWIYRTFQSPDKHTLSKTAYISGNLFTDRVPETIGYLDKVWEYGWSDTKGCVPPRPITDRAIRCIRQSIADKYVIHYMQPHLPPVANDPVYRPIRNSPREGSGANKMSVWERIRQGELNPETVKTAYYKNLKIVLSQVSTLLRNADARRVVITADHGNYFGEKGKWGHPSFDSGAPVRHVPWWETTAVDQHSHNPSTHSQKSLSTDRESLLKSLGYT